MKLCVIKLGARIATTGTSGGSGEALSIIEMLQKGGRSVDCYTKIINEDNPLGLKLYDIISEYDKLKSGSYDALIVINGNTNFYAGMENEYELWNYIVINEFKGPVFYIMCDPNLTLKQLNRSVDKKPWGIKYKDRIEIKRKDIVYICQMYNLEVAKALIDRQGIEINKIFYYPLEKFPLLRNRLDFVENRVVDLRYGGTFRSSKREKKMVKYLFGLPDNIKVEIFGKVKLDNFNPKLVCGLKSPIFAKSVQYVDYLKYMSNALSTIVIGDKIYEGNNLNQRIYESILANNIVFIDRDLDPAMRALLQEGQYVSSKEELISKINILKSNDNEYIRNMCDIQFDCVKIDRNKYCQDFVNIIGGNL